MPATTNTTRRLIETWLPIAELGEESVRERRSMTALPPTYYLHVWWARRPLVASRAAVLASLLPADADRAQFLRVVGIHGDPVGTRRRIDAAKRTGENLGLDPYGYRRAFTYCPSDEERSWLALEGKKVGVDAALVLDPTAGGGSIPFEAVRMGFDTLANDLNPVAATILKATVDWPARHGTRLLDSYARISAEFMRRAEPRFRDVFPSEPDGALVDGYLWSRTITCPYCEGLIPLSPNWRLAPDGTGVRLRPDGVTKRCDFEIVSSAKAQSEGTVSGGDATCPFEGCGRVVDGEEVKRQAQAGAMGEQLFAVVFKRRVVKTTKSGKGRESWERGYRAPRPEDDVSATVRAALERKLPEWEALDLVPSEEVPGGLKTTEVHRYGARLWRDLFSARQLLGHGTSVEVYRELLDEARHGGALDAATEAAFVHLAFSLDKLLNYNSRMSVWTSTREVVANTFNRHDFAFCWSYAEMAPCVTGLGYDWAIGQTGKCIGELVDLASGTTAPKPAKRGSLDLFASPSTAPADHPTRAAVTVTCRSGDDLSHVGDGTVDAVVMDPPYYDNVMYAELSDFFYVWLKRTAGHVLPELFTRRLTDKEREAVANPSKFDGQKGAKALAAKDYQERMARIFTECRRVLKPDGVLTLMFTHKATGAWDALTKGLMAAGFAITASWPINTEAEGSLHIKEKSAANSTIFLVCRPREIDADGAETRWWEEVEPLVAEAVRARVAAFQEAGIRGVDLYLSCFGPALEEFSRHWPLRRGQPKDNPALKKRKQAVLVEEAWDPYAVTPEDALDAARREVKRWRLAQLTGARRQAELDPLTEWFVLAWDAFEAPEFPYDEALRLARVVGLDLDADVVGRLAEKKGSDLLLWDSARRAAKGALGPSDGSRAMIDALHHAAYLGRTRTLEAGKDLLERAHVAESPALLTALTAVLEVLPVSRAFTHVEEAPGAIAEAASDFEALEGLRRLAFSEQVGRPKQLEMWE